MQVGLSQKRVGIIGCGAIGGRVARALGRGAIPGALLSGLCDRFPGRARHLSKGLRSHPPLLDLDTLVAQSDILIECAEASVVPELLRKVIRKKKDLLIMSTGGLWGREALLREARKRGLRIVIPSGALFGIDGFKASSLQPIRKATLTTRKPPRSFEGAPFVLERRIRLDRIRRSRLLFRGNVREALRAFPQNLNVAQTLVLSGIDTRRLEVRIIADPTARRNSHEVTLEGTLGRLTARCENLPSKENPRTSRLAIFSALAALKALLDPVRVGT